MGQRGLRSLSFLLPNILVINCNINKDDEDNQIWCRGIFKTKSDRVKINIRLFVRINKKNHALWQFFKNNVLKNISVDRLAFSASYLSAFLLRWFPCSRQELQTCCRQPFLYSQKWQSSSCSSRFVPALRIQEACL